MDTGQQQQPDDNNHGLNLTAILELLKSRNNNNNNIDDTAQLDRLEQSFHCGNGSNNAATLEQLIHYVDVSFWVDGVCQSAVATLGVLINCLALPVLLSKRLQSVFNCLLTILLLAETTFILSTCFETFRQNLRTNSHFSNLLFAYLLYPLKNCLLYWSVYMAVVMSRERYIALRCPIKYHNETSGLNPWGRAAALASPFAILSSIFVIPLVFEAKLESTVMLVENTVEQDEEDVWLLSNDSSYDDTIAATYHNVTVNELTPSDLRFDDHYVLLYKNLANFSLTMILPFTLLAFYNWRILSVLRRRRRMINRPAVQPSSRSAMLKAEEARKAYVLLAITVLFLACHSARLVLGLHECIFVREYQEGVLHHCNPSPLWVLVLHSVSNLLLTTNASLCSILYCLTSQDFQQELKTHYAWFKEQVSPSQEGLPMQQQQQQQEGMIPGMEAEEPLEAVVMTEHRLMVGDVMLNGDRI